MARPAERNSREKRESTHGLSERWRTLFEREQLESPCGTAVQARGEAGSGERERRRSLFCRRRCRVM